MASELNGQTDLHSDYSANLWVVQNYDVRSLNIVVIDDFDLHSFQFKINIVIFGIFLRFSSLSSFVTGVHTSGWTIFK